MYKKSVYDFPLFFSLLILRYPFHRHLKWYYSATLVTPIKLFVARRQEGDILIS